MANRPKNDEKPIKNRWANSSQNTRKRAAGEKKRFKNEQQIIQKTLVARRFFVKNDPPKQSIKKWSRSPEQPRTLLEGPGKKPNAAISLISSPMPPNATISLTLAPSASILTKHLHFSCSQHSSCNTHQTRQFSRIQRSSVHQALSGSGWHTHQTLQFSWLQHSGVHQASFAVKNYPFPDFTIIRKN